MAKRFDVPIGAVAQFAGDVQPLRAAAAVPAAGPASPVDRMGQHVDGDGGRPAALRLQQTGRFHGVRPTGEAGDHHPQYSSVQHV